MKTIKEVSQFSGVSIRTLRYYDQIRLLQPSTRTAAGYRLYNDDDILKLQQILFLKELNFRLKDIKAFLNKSSFSRVAIFKQQKELLQSKRQRIDQIIQVLHQLESGASLDECAELIKSIPKEVKCVEKTLKLSAVIIISMTILFVAYRTLQANFSNSNHSTISTTMPDVQQEIININSVSAPYSDVAARDLVLRQISTDLLPNNAPLPTSLTLPEGLKSNIILQGLYSRSLQSIEYTELMGYLVEAHDNNRMIQIYFSFRDDLAHNIFTLDSEPSMINNHEVIISRYEQQSYDNQATSTPIEKYYVNFSAHGLHFKVETQGINEAELILLIKSLL